MNGLKPSADAIKVCQGPGCRAWGSRSVLQTLRSYMKQNSNRPRKVCSSPCMNRCGGGACIQMVASHSYVKVKESSEALNVLCTAPVLS